MSGVELAVLASAALAVLMQWARADVGDDEGDGVYQTPFEKLELLAQAIAQAEGFNSPDASVIPRARHNPGDLTSLGGQIKTFATDGEGWTALYEYLDRVLSGRHPAYSLGMTFKQMGLVYAGGDANWSRNVCSYLGVSESQTLAEWVVS